MLARAEELYAAGPIVWLYGCSSGPNDILTFNSTSQTLSVDVRGGLCFGVEQDDPAGSTADNSLQAWAKPVLTKANAAPWASADGVAVLLINPDTQPHEFQVPLSVLPLTGAGTNVTTKTLSARDIWKRADMPQIGSGTTDLVITVPPMDSAFVLLRV